MEKMIVPEIAIADVAYSPKPLISKLTANIPANSDWYILILFTSVINPLPSATESTETRKILKAVTIVNNNHAPCQGTPKPSFA